MAAACVSFGFVLIHPFMDGNGRLSRFLFHHQLCQSGQLPDGLILPVSIAMARHEREYLQALQSFSKLARECWRVQSIDRDRFHFTFTGAPSVYRYWDATPCVEFGLKMARNAVDLHLQGQLRTLQQYDTVVRTINRHCDPRGPILRTLIIACMEQRGRLSKRRRDQYAYVVPDGAFEAIEREVFG